MAIISRQSFAVLRTNGQKMPIEAYVSAILAPMKGSVARHGIVVILLIFLASGCATVNTAAVDPMAVLRQSAVDRHGNPVVIEAEYILLYYGAAWCPYCLAWSEELNEQYRQLKGLYGSVVELIFVGHPSDRGDHGLRSFIEEGAHAFGYLPIAKREATHVMDLIGKSPFYIPGLLLIDHSGEVIASSSGEKGDVYDRGRPLFVLQGLLDQDCEPWQK